MKILNILVKYISILFLFYFALIISPSVETVPYNQYTRSLSRNSLTSSQSGEIGVQNRGTFGDKMVGSKKRGFPGYGLYLTKISTSSFGSDEQRRSSRTTLGTKTMEPKDHNNVPSHDNTKILGKYPSERKTGHLGIPEQYTSKLSASFPTNEQKTSDRVVSKTRISGSQTGSSYSGSDSRVQYTSKYVGSIPKGGSQQQHFPSRVATKISGSPTSSDYSSSSSRTQYTSKYVGSIPKGGSQQQNLPSRTATKISGSVTGSDYSSSTGGTQYTSKYVGSIPKGGSQQQHLPSRAATKISGSPTSSDYSTSTSGTQYTSKYVGSIPKGGSQQQQLPSRAATKISGSPTSSDYSSSTSGTQYTSKYVGSIPKSNTQKQQMPSRVATKLRTPEKEEFYRTATPVRDHYDNIYRNTIKEQLYKCCYLLSELLVIASIGIQEVVKNWTGDSSVLEEMLNKILSSYGIVYESSRKCKVELARVDLRNQLAKEIPRSLSIPEDVLNTCEREYKVDNSADYEQLKLTLKHINISDENNNRKISFVNYMKKYDRQCSKFLFELSRRMALGILNTNSRVLLHERMKLDVAIRAYFVNELMDEEGRRAYDKYVLNLESDYSDDSDSETS